MTSSDGEIIKGNEHDCYQMGTLFFVPYTYCDSELKSNLFFSTVS